MSATLRVCATLIMMVFLLSMVVQWNDPDPVRWTFLYGMGALLSAAAALGHGWRLASALAAGIYALGALSLIGALPHTSLEAFASVSMESAQAERVRELWGLLVCLAWSVFLLQRTPGRRQDTGG